MVVAKGAAILPADLPVEVTAAALAVRPAATETSPSAPAPASAASSIPSAPLDLPAIARALFRFARADPKLKVLPAVERELVIEALKETKGNQVQAAKLLGITRATLRKRVDKFGIRQELAVH
jgi:two-component system nitrogen regulation response regulator GlnG